MKFFYRYTTPKYESSRFPAKKDGSVGNRRRQQCFIRNPRHCDHLFACNDTVAFIPFVILRGGYNRVIDNDRQRNRRPSQGQAIHIKAANMNIEDPLATIGSHQNKSSRSEERLVNDSSEFIQKKRRKQYKDESNIGDHSNILETVEDKMDIEDTKIPVPVNKNSNALSSFHKASPPANHHTTFLLPPLPPIIDSPSHKKKKRASRDRLHKSNLVAPPEFATLERFDALEIAMQGAANSSSGCCETISDATMTASHSVTGRRVNKKQPSSPNESSSSASSSTSLYPARRAGASSSSSSFGRQTSLARSESFKTESSSRTSVSRADSTSTAAEFEFYSANAKRTTTTTSPINHHDHLSLLLPTTQLLHLTSQSDSWPQYSSSLGPPHSRPDDPVASALLDDDTVESFERTKQSPLLLMQDQQQQQQQLSLYSLGSSAAKGKDMMNEQPAGQQQPQQQQLPRLATKRHDLVPGAISNGGGCWTKIAPPPPPSRRRQSPVLSQQQRSSSSTFHAAKSWSTAASSNHHVHNNDNDSNASPSPHNEDSTQHLYKRIHPMVLFHKADSERSMMCLPEMNSIEATITTATSAAAAAVSTVATVTPDAIIKTTTTNPETTTPTANTTAPTSASGCFPNRTSWHCHPHFVQSLRNLPQATSLSPRRLATTSTPTATTLPLSPPQTVHQSSFAPYHRNQM
jgi:hypothetical protein